MKIKIEPFTMSMKFWINKNPKNKMVLDSYTYTFRQDLHDGNVLQVELYDENNKPITLFLRRSTKIQ